MEQEEIPATPQLPALTSTISPPQLQAYNPQDELQLKILLTDLMKKEKKEKKNMFCFSNTTPLTTAPPPPQKKL